MDLISLSTPAESSWRGTILGPATLGKRKVHDGYRERYMIRKLQSGEYRLYSRKKDPKTGKRRNLGTFKARQAAVKHERAIQFFKRRS